MLARKRQHQILDRKLHIHHAACAVLDIEHIWLDGACGAQLVAHSDDFIFQCVVIARCIDNFFTNRFEFFSQCCVSTTTARARHGLVFPCPRRVAAALGLVICKGVE